MERVASEYAKERLHNLLQQIERLLREQSITVIHFYDSVIAVQKWLIFHQWFHIVLKWRRDRA